MSRKSNNYSDERLSLENYNYEDKYASTGESSFSRDLTIPFDENEALSVRNYGHRGNLYGRDLQEQEAERVRSFEEDDYTGVGPKGYTRSDERILEDVCDALYVSPDIDASGIEVDVNHGIVTLKGTVENRMIKKIAENVIDHVSGVVDVRNEVHVQPRGRIEDNIT